MLSTRPGRLVFISAPDGRLRVESTVVEQPFGLAVGSDRLAVAVRRAVVVFSANATLSPRLPTRPDQFDAYFTPRTIHLTGECAMHDMAFDSGAITGVNTSFSCLCRIDGAFSFTPLWRPPFIGRLRPHDCCHLNGMAFADGAPRYVTALALSDEPEGWRRRPANGGLLIEVESGRVLREDLCMPHSPRLIEDELVVLNGGEGEVLKIDRATGASSRLVGLPGFAHGLCSSRDVLFVGLSQDRVSRRGSPPPVAGRGPMVAGVAAVDARTGRLLGLLTFEAGVTEVYDVHLLPGRTRAGLQPLNDSGPVAVETPEALLWMEPRDA